MNQSLARGLASTLTDWLVGAGEDFRSSLDNTLVKAAPGLESFNQKRANRFLADLRKCGKKALHSEFISFEGRKTGCIFIAPRGCDGRVDFLMVMLNVDGRHGFDLPNDVLLFRASKHSLERLYLRLRTLDHEHVCREIVFALAAAVNVRMAAKKVGARQVALPTASGAFICTIGEEQLATAVTWLSDQVTGDRWSGVITALRACPALSEFGVECWDQVAAVLAPFTWLKEEYIPRPDTESELWTAARLQSSKQEASEMAHSTRQG